MSEPQTHLGRTAVITGAGRGIGHAVAVKLAQRGARVALVDLTPPEEAAARLPGNALAITADVSTEAGWAHIGQRVKASSVAPTSWSTTPVPIPRLPSRISTTRNGAKRGVELGFALLQRREFVPGMRKKKWGRFVNVSSNSIGTNLPGLCHYMAAKMGVIGLVRALANEVGQDGITVNAIVPAITNTPVPAKSPRT